MRLLVIGKPASGNRTPRITAASASVSGSDITISATTNKSIEAGVFGAEYGIGRSAGYTSSKNVVGAASSQSITIGAGEGIAANDIVNVRAYYNLDVLDGVGTRVYGSAIVPDLGARAAPSGTVTSGQTLTVASSTEVAAAGASAMTISYQWQRSTDASFVSPAPTNIGTNSNQYTLTDSEIGNYVRCVVTETNSAGAASVSSSATATTVAANAVTFDAATAYWTGTSPAIDPWASISHTPSGNHNYAVLAVASYDEVPATAGTATYGGNAMTLLKTVTGALMGGARVNLHLFGRALGATSGGTPVNAVYNPSNTTRGTATVYTFNNVNQATPVDAGHSNDATGTSTAPSVAVTSAAGEYVVDVCAVENAAPTCDASQTVAQTAKSHTGGNVLYSTSSREAAVGASTTMSWTVTSNLWRVAAISLKVA